MMEVFLIAALHALPPFLGSLVLGWTGLVWGTRIGILCAFVFGVLILTLPDLFGVMIGAFMGMARLKGADAKKDLNDLIEDVFPKFARKK